MNYEEGIALGLSIEEINNLPNMGIEKIAMFLEENPRRITFVKKVLEENGKALDVQALINYLVHEIDEPYLAPVDGYDSVEGKKNLLKKLGYTYEYLKEMQNDEEDSEVEQW